MSDYLIWEVVQRAKSKGYIQLDLLSAPNPGIPEFKSKFDPVLEPYCAVARFSRLNKIVNLAYKKLRSIEKVKHILAGGGSA
ncbi:MAG: hypothetical protein ACXV7G_10565 [Halobacteriota archaeon]